MNHVKWIWRLWRDHKKFILLLSFMTIVSAGVTVGYPLVFRELLDKISEILKSPDSFPAPQQEIYRIVWILVAVGIGRMIAGFYPALRAYMNYLFEYTLRKKYFASILKKDYRFFNKYRTGDLVTRLTDDLSDFPKIGWFLCSGIFRAFDSFNKIIFCIAVMFFMSWELTLLALIPVPLMIIVFYFTSEELYRRFKKNQEAISDINNQLELSFSGIRIIKAFTGSDKYMRFFNDALNRRFSTEMNVVKLNTMLHLIYQYIDRVAQIVIVVFGGIMVVRGEISIGTFYAFYTYLALLIYPILDLPQLFVSGKQAFVNIDRLEDVKDYPVEKEGRVRKHSIEKVESVKFVGVDFCYDNDCILKNLDFTVKRGEKVVIIGPVGSGKTTILGLLTGLLHPSKGSVFINDIPIDRISVEGFRNKIGYVPQEPLLFSGTIKDNVIFGTDSIEQELYDRIIETVQMDREIEGFSGRHETKIGQRGLALSGGQKQRLAIARALIRKPEILILDDITASLDTDNEKKLWEEIDRTYKDITCFVVSNRLSTIKYADNVIFLDSGTVLGKGKHSELYSSYPEYRTFVEEHYLKSE
ncbi:MAG: ABC transporter ATP-binding protein [bacterium]